ncbi:putative Ig domain-containing protein [Thalassomonas sp. M1454]|uniref:putative Ig domain-containing protein n=1 Tax=Thalassomonas sp. M1454 TaxID=2594477 RepID=UPI00117DE478|nr:putative Ig domain-containing protein [Thalassomonas sp. M1454]TRX54955.1 hypothetical protein FNN08_10145 [Thalassomonas sp. M1454]
MKIKIIKSITIGFFSVYCALTNAANFASNKYYTVEMRGSGEKDIFQWRNLNNNISFSSLRYKTNYDMRMQFIEVANNQYHISSSLSSNLLSSQNGSVGHTVFFEVADGSDSQIWIANKVDADFVQFINKSTGLALTYTTDTDESPDHHNGLAVLAPKGTDTSTHWRVVESVVSPVSNIGVNQNGWHVDVPKQITYLSDTQTPPSFVISGPKTLSGTMAYWGEKWGKHFYTTDVSSLKQTGHYKVDIAGQSKSFSVVDDAFAYVRKERGGSISWQDIIDGHMKMQKVDSDGDLLDVAIGYAGEPDYLEGEEYTLTNGYYDASSIDNKIYRTANIYQYLALAILESDDSEKSQALIPVLEEGINWLADTQNADASWPLGKVRVSGDDYYWSITTDPAGVARVAASLAIAAQALSTTNPTLANNAQQMAVDAWAWVKANSQDSDFVGVNDSYFGSQHNLIAAAIELYILTNNSEYKTYADVKINQAVLSSGGLYKSGGADWPGQATSRRASLINGHLFVHLARYYQVIDAASDSALKTKVANDLASFITYWQTSYVTPYNIPENLGGPNIQQGWARSMGTFALQAAYAAYALDSDDGKALASASWDFLTGHNTYASNLYVGGRGQADIPLWHQPWEKHTGAVVPGVLIANGEISQNNKGYEFSETVIKDNIALIPYFILMNKMFPASATNTAPEFFAEQFSIEDIGVNESYSYALSQHTFDRDGDNLTYSKISGPDWLFVAEDGNISGLPLAANLGENSLQVSVTDSKNTSVQATISLNVNDFGSPLQNIAPVWYLAEFTLNTATVDKEYLSWINDKVSDNDDITISKLTGPDWLIVHANGKLEGSPSSSDLGENTFIVAASDGINMPVEAEITIEVLAPAVINSAPTWNSDSFSVGTVEQDKEFSASIAEQAADIDADVLTFNLVSGPSWLNLSAQGELSGKPSSNDIGINSFVVTVNDGINPSVEAVMAVEVTTANNDSESDTKSDSDADSNSGGGGSLGGWFMCLLFMNLLIRTRSIWNR